MCSRYPLGILKSQDPGSLGRWASLCLFDLRPGDPDAAGPGALLRAVTVEGSIRTSSPLVLNHRDPPPFKWLWVGQALVVLEMIFR